jgi:hypothetical protein
MSKHELSQTNVCILSGYYNKYALYVITQIDVILQENKIKSIYKVLENYFGWQISLLKDYLLSDGSENKSKKTHINILAANNETLLSSYLFCTCRCAGQYH